MRNLFYVLIVFILSSANIAYAHSPYTEDVQNVDFDGEIVTVQRLFGDGIFFADPVSLQLTNQSGGVIAYTKAGNSVTALCSTKSFCWGFVFNIILPLAEVYKFQPEQADWKASESIKDYPEYSRKENSYAFQKSFNPAMSFVGLAMLIKNYSIWYLAPVFAFGLLWLQQRGTEFIKRKDSVHKGVKFALTALNMTLQAVATVTVLIMLFIAQMYIGLPVLSLYLVVLSLGIVVAAGSWLIHRLEPASNRG